MPAQLSKRSLTEGVEHCGTLQHEWVFPAASGSSTLRKQAAKGAADVQQFSFQTEQVNTHTLYAGLSLPIWHCASGEEMTQG